MQLSRPAGLPWTPPLPVTLTLAARLASLGALLRDLFGRDRALADLDAAIKAEQAAVDAASPRSPRPRGAPVRPGGHAAAPV